MSFHLMNLSNIYCTWTYLNKISSFSSIHFIYLSISGYWVIDLWVIINHTLMS